MLGTILQKSFQIFLLLSSLFTIISPKTALAVGAWNGQDLYHVPISWCAVQGSPAASNPNITSIETGVTDTNTDAVLWRRHERPSENIYINQAGITFRSAINSSWGTLNFPIIADPNPPAPAGTGLGLMGDIRGEDVNAFGMEYNQLLAACDNAWNNLGRAGIGITAVNVNLFHDAAGDYVGVIGWGGCTKSVTTGNCTTPFDGQIAVIDNNYLYPTVTDRTFPPSPADPPGNLQFITTDPLDQLVGHEFGHALSLNHRNNLTALMNPQQTDNDGDGQADNVTLNNTEINNIRVNAQNVSGTEIDPPAQINPGDFVRTRIPDEVGKRKDLPNFMDIAAIDVTLDKKKKLVHFGVRFFGIIPDQEKQKLWILLDTDGKESGVAPAHLKELGIPESKFSGTDLIFEASVTGRAVEGSVLEFENGKLEKLPHQKYTWDLNRLILEPHFLPLPGKTQLDIKRVPIYDVAVVTMPWKDAKILLGKPFGIQAIVQDPKRNLVEKLHDTQKESELMFVVDNPSFPHCFAQGVGKPGSKLKVKLERLVPNKGIHGLIGPREVFKGLADSTGGGLIELPIPQDTKPGVHLVTIGTDNTALTADCTITVEDSDQRKDQRLDPRHYSLLKSHETLLKGQQGLLKSLGAILHELITTFEVESDIAIKFGADYQKLMRQQAGLVERFEKLIREIITMEESIKK